MSAEARSITAAQFALAIQDLPVENIYSKAHEIQNSIEHLRKSNAQLQEYSDSIKNDVTLDVNTRSDGDKDCLDAISENEIVIRRQLERIELLKGEVERRGGRWHEGEAVPQPGFDGTNGITEQSENGHQPTIAPSTRPRLTDEELRRQLEQQLGDDDGDEGRVSRGDDIKVVNVNSSASTYTRWIKQVSTTLRGQSLRRPVTSVCLIPVLSYDDHAALSTLGLSLSAVEVPAPYGHVATVPTDRIRVQMEMKGVMHEISSKLDKQM